MSSDIASFFQVFSLVWTAVEESALFAVLVWFLGIYGIILLADVILLLFLRDIPGDLKKTLYGNNRPFVSHSKFFKRWQEISSRLGSGNPSQYKAAILEADAIADEMLSGIGYEGANMGERIAAVKEGHIESIGGVREAHDVRNRIIRDPNFSISKEEVERVIGKYKRLFDELELL